MLFINDVSSKYYFAVMRKTMNGWNMADEATTEKDQEKINAEKTKGAKVRSEKDW